MLEIDAGFAGGVCRCRQCGTIQTVPERAAQRGDRPPVPMARVTVPQGVATARPPADVRLMLAVGMAAMLALIFAALALAFLEREHRAALPAARLLIEAC